MIQIKNCWKAYTLGQYNREISKVMEAIRTEPWDRRWQLAKQRTDSKIIELHQISANVQEHLELT